MRSKFFGACQCRKYARLAIGNTFTGNQNVTGNVSATGSVATGSLTIGGGTPIVQYVSITDTITLPVINTNVCKTFTTAAVAGFTPGTADTISIGTPKSLVTGLGAGVFLLYEAWETTNTASPTITIQVCNPSTTKYAGGASGTLRINILKN